MTHPPETVAIDHERLKALDHTQRLYNEDLAPAKERNWKGFSIFALWTADVHSIGGYTFAAGLFFLGLIGWQVLLALVLGIVIVLVGMNLIGWAGQRTGVPYPVFSRLSFGVFGANLPALIRAIIAIAFYGIQTYLASVALLVLGLRIFPSLQTYTEHGFLGLSWAGWVCFMALWVLQLLLFQRGMEMVRRFVDFAGPAIWIVMIVLAVSIVVATHGHLNFSIGSTRLSGPEAWRSFLAAISLTVAYFSTLLLNYCDFSRFAPTRRSITIGNFWGLPVNYTAFAILSVVVTAGSITLYGQAITDPVLLVAKVQNTAVLVVGALVFTVATIGINVVANFVSPAYDLANVWPKHITFRRGGAISAVVAIIVLPWKLYSTPVIINYFLGGLAAFLGPLFGILMVDYYLLRRQRVVIEDLYRATPDSTYYYRAGWNPKALIAFIPAAAVSAVCALVPGLGNVAAFSWFIGAALGALLYYVVAVRGSSSSTIVRAPRPDVAPPNR
ncbi:MAG: NCS1 family nucleobase:cation symporter-1 [Candidatus Dormibacteraeota bacterium]|nr:NCS1 family nucleobase:cation symporter-1 [Candidatus Dormibacteraeota bacterium]